ncbi:hypothetical protein J6590_059583 [Homalodisca vitripennis]|nr:hypothetical protein J6590_059583 [Homalodisca vitripennis]
MEILSSILEENQSHNRYTIIIGDINIDNLKQDVKSRILEQELTTHNIRRLALPATRVTPESATSIDCICSNLPQTNISAEVFQTGLSDHTAQQCWVNIQLEDNKLR